MRVSNIRSVRPRRGIIIILAAVLLALAAFAFALTMETSQKFLQWKVIRSNAEAAALTAVLALDGTPPGLERARTAAAEVAHVEPKDVEIIASEDGDLVRVSIARGGMRLTTVARQREVPEPDLDQYLATEPRLAAPNPNAPGFGLKLGGRYTLHADAAIGATAGSIVAVGIHSGFPKELPLTWIAGRVISTQTGKVEIEYLGGYLRGARHAAARPYGYFEATLGIGEPGIGETK